MRVSLVVLLVVLLLATCEGRTFPESFMWGTATSSYQVEGAWNVSGKVPSIWDIWTHNTPSLIFNNETGDVADDHFHRYPEDIALMASHNIKNYRLSISWSRVMNADGSPNEAGIQFYIDVFETLRNNSIAPFVTLYHWDLPQFYQDMGGWLNESCTEWFADYAALCFDRFGPYVPHWLTFNEPWSFILGGYDNGYAPPGRCSVRPFCSAGNSSTEPYLVGHHVLLSHVAAVAVFRNATNLAPGAKIGITLNCDWAIPYSNTTADLDAQQRFALFFLGWFADPLYFGEYPWEMRDTLGDILPTFTPEQSQALIQSHDFFGLNHYTTSYAINATVTGTNWQGWMGVNTTKFRNGVAIGPAAASSWLYVYPPGLLDLLRWISARYSNPPIFITENGCDVPGESSMTAPEVLYDPFRMNFYSGYIGSVATAMSEGINVLGYFAWSLMDNFEWNSGYSLCFGLTWIDREDNLNRVPKASLEWFGTLASSGNIPPVPGNASESSNVSSDNNSGKHGDVPKKHLVLIIAGCGVSLLIVACIAYFVYSGVNEKKEAEKKPLLPINKA